MKPRQTRLAPLTGALFVASLVAAYVIVPSSPDSNASPATVISYYSAHRSASQVQSYLFGLAAVFGVFFFASLCGRLREDAGAERLANAAFGGAILLAVGLGLIAGTNYTLADVPRLLAPAAAQSLNALSNDVFMFIMFAGIAALLGASGLAIVRTRTLPRWLGWTAILFGTVSLTPAAPVGFYGIALWTLAASIALYIQEGAGAAGRDRQERDDRADVAVAGPVANSLG